MSSWGKHESLMIVCCSFGRWGRSLSEHSRVLQTLALLQFLRNVGRRGGGFCMWSLQFSSQGPLVGCLSLIEHRIIWRSFQAKDERLSQFQACTTGGTEMKRAQALPPRRGPCSSCGNQVPWLSQQPPISSLCLHS